MQAALVARHHERAGSASLFILGKLPGAEPAGDAIWGIARSCAALSYRTLLARAVAGVRREADLPAEGEGAAGYTSGEGMLALRSTGIAGLSLLRLHHACPHRDEATGVRRLRAAASAFDIILIETSVSDAAMLAALAAGSDGIALFAGRHRTRVDLVEAALATIGERKDDMLAIALV